jgi:putative PIN family toxin of toxin-antitoxin system
VKVVLDTNVFVSGVFFKGPPHWILLAWRDGKLQLVISPEILDEYRARREHRVRLSSVSQINSLLLLCVLCVLCVRHSCCPLLP